MSQNLPALAGKSDTYLTRGSEIPLAVPPLRMMVRRPSLWGVALIVLFFGIGGGWATTAQLSGAVIAPGSVSSESRRQTIQHLEGGIIRAVRVTEGDRVNAGDELVVLDDVAAGSDNSTLRNRLIALVAQEARLEAERKGLKAVEFIHPALADRTNPVVRDAIQQEETWFRGRAVADDGRRAVLEQRIAQLRAQVGGYTKQLEAARQQAALLQREFAVADDLLKKGLERAPRVLSIQRSMADRAAAEGELQANIARANDAMAEVQLQIQGIGLQRAETIDTERADAQAKRAEVEEQLRKSGDRLTRTVIRAPAPGVVLNIKLKTPGAVVRPGDPILDLVPTGEQLIIDAKVSPKDIDEVHIGLVARVVFPSYPQRGLLRITGRVHQVSADSVQDDRTGERFFTARVEIDRNHLKEAAPGLELVPGLPVEVYIATVDRTLSDYLIQPIRLAVERSFRER